MGIYQQIDVRMRKQPPPQYRGHVAIELADGALVALEPSWSRAAIRDKSERDHFDGKSVEVIGIVHITTPPPPEPVAHTTGLTISPVESITIGRCPRGLPI